MDSEKAAEGPLISVANSERRSIMVNTFDWLRLISRVCILAILTGTLVYEFAETKVQAATTCVQCDQNYGSGLYNCDTQKDSCDSACWTVAHDCILNGNSYCDSD